jgi:iron complex outermembrane receptor protein
MRFLLTLIGTLIFVSTNILPQSTFKAFIKDADSGLPLYGVNVFLKGTQTGDASDMNGYIEIKNIPDGGHRIEFSYIGYENYSLNLSFPAEEEITYTVLLEHNAEELEEIYITTTRGSRLIDDEPTRVEVIAGEEIDEKINMDPSSISMLLSETTGIQVQQTSASSVNNSFRIQGLEGRYTQLLKDGFPLYTGFSGSLSISQILPLDLSQVEIIKGSSSTLYGGGAIAGLINLVSKRPSQKRDISFLANVTSALGFDLSGYYSQKFESYGLSLFAARNTQQTYDNNEDDFSDLPQIERYTINPQIYVYFSEKTSFEVGGTYITENRIGGYIPSIGNNNDTAYTEENKSDRFASQIKLEHKLNKKDVIVVKNSIGLFNRNIYLPDYRFEGKQLSSFSEIVYSNAGYNSDWIFGANLITDKFEDDDNVVQSRSYYDLTAGFFLQNTSDFSDVFSLESGFRTDYNKEYGWFPLPRISLLIRISEKITSRIGGGFGYKTPNIFTEAGEQLNLRNVEPIDKELVKAERSYGINFDINYKTIFADEFTFSINQLFFYTRINDPLSYLYDDIAPLKMAYISLPGHTDTRGAETNIRFTYDHYKLYIGYTFTDARNHIGDFLEEFAVTPKHKLGLILFYEKHGEFRIGLEAYYTGKQKLSNGSTSTDFWITGLMIEKHFGQISAFLNFENFLDTRQSRYGPMYIGSPSDPTFTEIYAPTDGRIINGGIRIKI